MPMRIFFIVCYSPVDIPKGPSNQGKRGEADKVHLIVVTSPGFIERTRALYTRVTSAISDYSNQTERLPISVVFRERRWVCVAERIEAQDDQVGERS